MKDMTNEQITDSKKLITIIRSVPADKRAQFEASLNGYLDGYAAGYAARESENKEEPAYELSNN